MFYFEILRSFGENCKKEEIGKSSVFGFLRRSVGNPSCRVALRRYVGCPRCGEARVPKWNPSGTLQHSFATPRHRYCSRKNKFRIFVPKV